MCGFFQVIQKNKPIDKEKFLSALNSMNHRGPDATGSYFSEININNKNYYIAFGHKRLSILDLDKRSNQPFLDDKNILLFNGEIYNFNEIKCNYEQNKIKFHTNSDTELVSKAFSLKRFEDMNLFNGMWALSFYNEKDNTLFLSRDRYGKKPLFYYQDNDVLCVSSTIKAIKKYLNLSIEFEEKYLLNYLMFGDMYPSDTSKTHFKDINQILPGHNAIFDIKNWSIKNLKYFDSTKNNDPSCDFSQESLALKLENSVKVRLNSDRPIALLLSGGIDSSLILSILHYLGYQDRVNVFMGDTGRSDDYKYAKKCVEQIGVKAETIVSDYSTNAFDRFLDICLHHEKAFPFNGNAVAMAQMFQEVSQNDIPVVLDGSGGDEIFGGYWQRYIPFALKDADKNKDTSWKNDIQKYNSKKKEVNTYLNYIKKESMFKKVFNPFLKVPLSKLLELETLDPLKNPNLNFDESLYKDVTSGGRLPDWIWHNDRNSMMYSVESRSPFLDFNLHNFIFSGYENKFKDDWNKYELRKVFDKFTPLPTQWRSEKQGFRWDGKHFFYNNKDQIIDIIKQSEVLKEYANRDLFCSVANNFPRIFKSSIGRRFLGIAGIEYTMKKN